jgi:hypothetical protein
MPVVGCVAGNLVAAGADHIQTLEKSALEAPTAEAFSKLVGFLFGAAEVLK